MKKTKLYSAFLAATLALSLVVTGCILSGQFVILFDIDQNIHSTDTVLGKVAVDLTTDETWRDHKDDIQAIVDIKFEAKFVNNEATAASGEVWIATEDYATVAQVEANATRILSGIVVPASGSKDVSFTESSDYIENLDTVLDLVEGGVFFLYGIAADVPFDITITGIDDSDPDTEHCRLMVTVSAKP